MAGLLELPLSRSCGDFGRRLSRPSLRKGKRLKRALTAPQIARFSVDTALRGRAGNENGRPQEAAKDRAEIRGRRAAGACGQRRTSAPAGRRARAPARRRSAAARRSKRSAARASAAAARSSCRLFRLVFMLGVWVAIAGVGARRLFRRRASRRLGMARARPPAEHPDPRRRRPADRQSRRHRRRGGEALRAAALRAERGDRDRGPPLPHPLRRRPGRPPARRREERLRRRRGGGRLDADPAARQEHVPDAGALAEAQGAGGDPRALAGDEILQGPDPGDVSEPRLFRLRRLRHRGGRHPLLQRRRARPDAGAGGDACRRAAGAEPLCAEQEPGSRAPARSRSCSPR